MAELLAKFGHIYIISPLLRYLGCLQCGWFLFYVLFLQSILRQTTLCTGVRKLLGSVKNHVPLIVDKYDCKIMSQIQPHPPGMRERGFF
jgi:hypothetical protein